MEWVHLPDRSEHREIGSRSLKPKLCRAARGSLKQGCADEAGSQQDLKSQISPLFKCKEVSSVCNKCTAWLRDCTGGQSRGCAIAQGKGQHCSPWPISELQTELRLSWVWHGPQPASTAPLKDTSEKEAVVGMLHLNRDGWGKGRQLCWFAKGGWGYPYCVHATRTVQVSKLVYTSKCSTKCGRDLLCLTPRVWWGSSILTIARIKSKQCNGSPHVAMWQQF